MTSLSASFGAVVRHLREERGWSQEQLAEFADLNRSYVGDLERGRAMPSLATMYCSARICVTPKAAA